jgi:molybdate transport system substrate-binding protein
VLRGSQDPALAQAFVSWITGPKGREILARYGYALP